MPSKPSRASKVLGTTKRPKQGAGRHWWVWLAVPAVVVLALGIGIPLLAQRGGQPNGPLSQSMASLPAWLRSSPLRVQQSYAYASERGDMLQYIPCFCGCGNEAHGRHLSNYNCFVQGVQGQGQKAYDEHGANCDMCVDIALDTQRLLSEGKSLKQVRQYVESRYGNLGPSTDTPPAP